MSENLEKKIDHIEIRLDHTDATLANMASAMTESIEKMTGAINKLTEVQVVQSSHSKDLEKLQNIHIEHVKTSQEVQSKMLERVHLLESKYGISEAVITEMKEDSQETKEATKKTNETIRGGVAKIAVMFGTFVLSLITAIIVFFIKN